MRSKILAYINRWESHGYPGGIPDEAPGLLEKAGRVPSYRVICMAIMRNDMALQSLGYSREPCGIYMGIKRAELLARGKIQPSRQLEMLW